MATIRTSKPTTNDLAKRVASSGAASGSSSSGGSSGASGNKSSGSSYKPSSSSSGSRTTGTGGSTIQVGASGNAPAGTSVGTIVKTAGGDYQVVAPGTPGASYNQANGLWSVKVTEPNGAPAAKADGYYANTGAPGTGYLNNSVNQSQSTAILPGGTTYAPTGSHLDTGMSQADLSAINSLKQAYEASKAAGDTAGMASAHNQAEAIRAKYGYSGGTDGSEFYQIEMPEEQIPMQGLPIYEAQVGATNSVYDAALKAAMAALDSAYEKSRFEAEAAMGKLPAIYQQKANAIAANAEKERQAFNESAAASGLNSGTGSQASLAMSNAMQNDLGVVRTAEANAIADAQNQLTLLYIEYQNGIAEAIANNEYERAAALLSEYQRQAQSVVDVAQAQAALNMETWSYNQGRKDTAYDRLVQQAETLAKFGDFSGYRALGLPDSQIAELENRWRAMLYA